MIYSLAYATIAAVGTLTCVTPPQSKIGERIAVVVDLSGSMSAGNARAYAIGVAIRFIEENLDAGEVKVYAFGDVIKEWPLGWRELPDATIAGHARRWLENTNVGFMNSCGGEALRIALSDPKDKISVVIITDGYFGDSGFLGLTRGHRWRKEMGLTRAPVLLYGIGKVNDAGLMWLAVEAGGGYWRLELPE